MENITIKIALVMIIALSLAYIWLQRKVIKDMDITISEMSARIAALKSLLRQRDKDNETLSKKLLNKDKEANSK